MISTSFIPQLDGLLLNYAWESYRQTTPLALTAGGSGFCFCTLLNCLVPAKKTQQFPWDFASKIIQDASAPRTFVLWSIPVLWIFVVCPLRPMALHPEQSGLHVSARRHLGGHPTQESWILGNFVGDFYPVLLGSVGQVSTTASNWSAEMSSKSGLQGEVAPYCFIMARMPSATPCTTVEMWNLESST